MSTDLDRLSYAGECWRGAVAQPRGRDSQQLALPLLRGVVCEVIAPSLIPYGPKTHRGTSRSLPVVESELSTET
jgi:hypothetical protein